MDSGKLVKVEADLVVGLFRKSGTIIAAFIMLLIFGGVTEVFSQQAGVIRKLTLAQVSELVSNQGWPVAKGDDTSIVTKIEGSSVRIAIDKTGENVMMLGVKRFDPKIMTFEVTNKFNELAFGKASTFKYEDSLVFLSNIEIEGGVTRDRVISFLKSARSAYVLWDELF
jgi:hypothetical protein